MMKVPFKNVTPETVLGLLSDDTLSLLLAIFDAVSEPLDTAPAGAKIAI